MISVVVPTYKPADYLWKCLDSIRTQSYNKELFEVIIVLNGCKEPYEARIGDYLSQYGLASWRLYQTNEGGVSNARNIGINNAKGEYVAFIDDDDFVSESYLQDLLDVSSEDTIGLCRPLAYDDTTKKITPYALTKEYDVKSLRGKQRFFQPRRLFAGPCMKLIHTSIIGERRFDKRFRNSEDSLFIFAISNKMKWADFSSKNAIYYRRYRTGSAIRTKRTFWEKSINALKIMREETVLYWSNFPHYNFCFYFTRLLGAIRGVLK